MRRLNRARHVGRLGTWVFTLGVLAALPGMTRIAQSAELRKLEAVGAVPIDPRARGGIAPRDVAIQRALKEAVSRVAREFLLDAEDAEVSPATLDEVLGEDMVQYTASFRIREDRGERPALFSEDADITTEYLVVMEVEVDAERVEGRLVEAGLLARRGSTRGLARMRIEADGVDVYAAYEALRDALRSDVAVKRVVPREFGAGVATLDVEYDGESAPILERLLRRPPPGLEVRSQPSEPGLLRLSLDWTPPPAVEPADLDSP